jgi:hypothetical protein
MPLVLDVNDGPLAGRAATYFLAAAALRLSR